MGTEALTDILLFMAKRKAITVLWQMVKTPAQKEKGIIKATGNIG